MHRQFFEGIATLSLAMTSKKKYVILSASEISHDLSGKYMHRQFFEGIATLSLAMTSKKKYVILSVSEISHDLSEKVYTLRKTTLPGDCFVASLPRKDK